MRRQTLPTLLALLLASLPLAASAGIPRVLPDGEKPKDSRLGALKDLNGYFPFAVPATKEAWAERAEKVRRQILVSQGLWPMPHRLPPVPVIHGKIDRDDYTVEKVYLASYPGHFVTGNLYRPKGKKGPFPGVLCPHGHWANGRFYDAGPDEVKKQIAAGAEKYDIGGRYPLQARCLQLARMGCVVFHYDMLGHADSVQIAHRPGVREHMNTPEGWGFFSPQAELHLQTMMGLQTFNSICALDFLCDLDDVDGKRIGVTGASGGGTQTFMLCAVDPRPTAAFPAVMVSTSMQGGCTCENASYLRLGTGNIEIAGLFAPKPLGMSAADDWTKEMTTKGYPELAQLYDMLGVKDNVFLISRTEFGHNYNYVSRAAMYSWFNRHLKLGQKEPIVEADFVPLTKEEMSVWNDEHKKPSSGDAYERSLVSDMTIDSEMQMEALHPRDSASLAEYRRVVVGAFEVLIHRGLPKGDELEWEKKSEKDQGNYLEFTGLLRYKPAGEELPVVFLHPKKWNKTVAIWLCAEGKSGLAGSDGSLKPAVQKLLDSGTCVAGLDLLYQGEFLADGQPLERARLLGSGRDAWKNYAGYTFGYNQSLFAQRTSDVLTLISWCRNHENGVQKVQLVGLDGAGVWAAAARAIAGPAVDKAAIDTAGFRFASLTSSDDLNFLPGSVKYGDVPAILALSAPHPLWVSGEKELPELVTKAYRAAGQPKNVSTYAGAQDGEAAAAVEWLMK
ncbi:MAG: acetylxylan esterase [Planctomycetia bacterium]|nr:acetylxylan esterase [Planctomycetia bacterium]